MNSCSSNFSETHLENDVKDVAVALEELLHVPLPGIIGHVAQVDLVVLRRHLVTSLSFFPSFGGELSYNPPGRLNTSLSKNMKSL